MRSICRLFLLGSVVMAGCGGDVTQPVDEGPVADRIAFASTRDSPWPHVYVTNSDGTGIARVALGSAPAWSWDGERIALYRDANPYDRAGIYVVNSDGSSERYLGPERYAAWSADGRIAVAGQGGLRVIGGSRLVDREWLVATLGEPCDPDEPWSVPGAASPAWSPDGSQITFLLTCGPGGAPGWSMPYVASADGGLPQPLLAWETRWAGRPAWSPDGSFIALIDAGFLTILNPAGGAVEGYDFGEVDALGSTLDWSPDGREIAFEAWLGDTRRIFVMSLEGGSGIRQLIPGNGHRHDDFDVAWSRVGDRP